MMWIFDMIENLKNKIHLGDCLDFMRQMPESCIDMVITSPPYDNLREYNKSSEWSFDVFKKIAKELSRVIKDGGTIVWNVSDATICGSETGTSFRQALYFKDDCGLNMHDTMIWNKLSFSSVGSLQNRYAPVFEYMFIFTKGKIKTFNPIKDRKNIHSGIKTSGTIRNKDGTTKPMSKKITIQEYGQRFNVWEIPPEKNNSNGFHPAPFSIKIALDHIFSWSNEKDVILDPFSGSGTTALACLSLNRNFICIEKDPDYHAASVKRLEEHQRQGKLL